MPEHDPKQTPPLAGKVFRADPRLISALHAIALLAALFGVGLFTLINVNADHQRTDKTLNAGIAHAASQTTLLADQLDLLRLRLQPSLDQALSPTATADQKLEARAALTQILDSSPSTGLIAWPASGTAPLKIGTAPIVARPLTDRADTVHTPERFSASTNKNIIIDHGSAHTSTNTIVNLVIPANWFESVKTANVDQMLIYNRGGDLLYASPSQGSILGDIKTTPDAALRNIFDTGVSRTGAAWKRVGNGDLIITGRSAVTPVAFFWRHLLLAASIALPVWLAVAIGLWRIGNEWRRLDDDWNHAQGVSDRYDAVAGAMNASVLEWSSLDGKIRYGGKWTDFFGDENLRETDEIFHWIERIHPDDVTRARMTYERLQYGRLETSCHDIRIRSASGEWVTVQETAVVCKNDQGRVDQIFLVLQRAEAIEEPYQRTEHVA